MNRLMHAIVIVFFIIVGATVVLALGFPYGLIALPFLVIIGKYAVKDRTASPIPVYIAGPAALVFAVGLISVAAYYFISHARETTVENERLDRENKYWYAEIARREAVQRAADEKHAKQMQEIQAREDSIIANREENARRTYREELRVGALNSARNQAERDRLVRLNRENVVAHEREQDAQTQAAIDRIRVSRP